jgi:hypothetical protein
MQIRIEQNELEVAVRDYIRKAGISRIVGEINFTATRSGGAGIVTEIEVSGDGVRQPLKTHLTAVTDEEIPEELDTLPEDTALAEENKGEEEPSPAPEGGSVSLFG